MTMEENIIEPAVKAMSDEPERGYVPNKGMPKFVGKTEFRRLRKIIDEKNALIEKFKKYDEERKEYYSAFMDDYKEMKESFDLFSQELLKVVDDGEMAPSEHKKFLKLYKNWFTYKSKAEYYKNRLVSARESVRDVRDDVGKLEDLLGRLALGSPGYIEVVVQRMMVMRKHLDILQSKLNID